MPPVNCQIKIVRDTVRVALVRYGVAAVAIVLGGCQSSHFEVVDPPSMVHTIDGSTDIVGSAGGIVYHATVVDALVVFRIENITSAPLDLSHSTLIAPDGAKHPLDVRTIPPGGFAKLILPPPPPDPTGGPLISIDLLGDSPRRAQNPPWIWPSDRDVTLQLSFTRPDGSMMLQSLRIRRLPS
jgi:hypothetical protein